VRVILVGTPRERALLRAEIEHPIEILAESDSLADARRNSDGADAFLVAGRGTVHGSSEEDKLVEPLTHRESQVLELLAEGLSNKGIGARLGISDQTAKFHVASIAGKLGARNRTETVRLAARRGLLSL
jgi:DNA-binding NarL/FixJ family response regulator